MAPLSPAFNVKHVVLLVAAGIAAILIATVIGVPSSVGADNCGNWTREKCTEERLTECRGTISAFNEDLRKERNLWKRDHENERGTPDYAQNYRDMLKEQGDRRTQHLTELRQGTCSVLSADDAEGMQAEETGAMLEE